MKFPFKILSSAILINLFLCSCSKDESEMSQSASTSNTIKRITENVYNSGGNPSGTMTTDVYNFNYNGNVLNSISNNTGNEMQFLMESDKIVKTKTKITNTADVINNITYNGANISSIIGENQNEKTEFTHSNNVLTAIKYFFKSSDGNWTLFQTQNLGFNAQQNIIRRTLTMPSIGSFTTTLDYDSSNHPFKNMNKYLKYLLIFETFETFGNNNNTKRYSVSQGVPAISEQTHNIVYIYNDANYPIAIKKYLISGSLISECFIEYN